MDDVTPIAERPPRRFRWLPIATSVFFGVLTVAVGILWARSFFQRDYAAGYLGPYYNFSAESQLGNFSVAVFPDSQNPGAPRLVFSPGPMTDEPLIERWVTGPFSKIGIRSQIGANSFVVQVSWWLPFLLFATLAIVPWVVWLRRFSLRTMLITTTLIAVVLGLAVWAGR